jgi:hypothetical protein
MIGAAKQASAKALANARTLNPDRHDPRNRDIMTVIKKDPVPPLTPTHPMLRSLAHTASGHGPTFDMPTIGRD